MTATSEPPRSAWGRFVRPPPSGGAFGAGSGFHPEAFGAQAQTTPAPAADGGTPAVATPETANAATPVEGANSFTEGQAKERIEAAGFTAVTDLKLDDKGIWQAMGTKDGKSAAVSLD